MNRRQSWTSRWMLLGAVLLLIVVVVWFLSLLRDTPRKVVEQFYAYESEAAFAKSWDMLHSDMKKKFPNQADYVQNRAHVFLQHMEVTTFSYDIGKSSKKKEWRMNSESKPLKEVYEVPVTLTFESRFGLFTLHQKAYVVKEKEWRLLWDYNF